MLTPTTEKDISSPKANKASPAPSIAKESKADDHIEKQVLASGELQAPDVNMAAGMTDFYAGNYVKAAETFKKIPITSLFYAESRLRLGQSQLALKQYAAAISTFKNIGRKSSFHFDAQWELAQTYLAKGDKEKAKKVLVALTKENNAFQGQAQQKLEEMK